MKLVNQKKGITKNYTLTLSFFINILRNSRENIIYSYKIYNVPFKKSIKKASNVPRSNPKQVLRPPATRTPFAAHRRSVAGVVYRVESCVGRQLPRCSNLI